MRLRYPHQVTVLTPTSGGVDSAGDPKPGTPSERATRGVLQQASSAEVLQGRDTTTTDALLLLPPGDTIAAADQVRDAAGRLYDVVGEPNRVPSGFGREDHVEVRLRRAGDV